MSNVLEFRQRPFASILDHSIWLVPDNADHVNFDTGPFDQQTAVPTVVRGGGFGKNSRQTSSNAKKSFQVDQKYLRLDHAVERAPAASNVFFRLFKIYRVCFLIADW
jgi:hypothetical protein